MVRRRSTARKKSSSRSGYAGTLGGPPARKNGGWVVLVLGALVVVNLYVFVWDKKTSVGAIKAKAEDPALAIPSKPIVPDNEVIDETPPGVGSSGAPATGSANSGQVPQPIAPPGSIDGKVGKTDTLGRLLKKSGLGASEANEVIRALTGVLDFKTIRQGETYHLERGPDGRVRLFELVVSKIHRVRAERNPAGELVGKADDTATKLETKAVGGRIDDTLSAAIKASGETASLVDFFVDTFAYELDFYNDTHEGDTFRIVVEKETGEGGAVLGYKRILAAEYRGKVGTFRIYNWNGNFFDDKGDGVDKALLKTPLKFTRVSSGFDRARMHPVLHTVREHLGIDYAAPVGTPVWAAAAGVVESRGPAGGAGNLVMIKHAGGVETAYMHLSKFADIKVGDKIDAKTVIGYVGQTGLATGPHLHFGVRVDGAYVDPTKLPPMHGSVVAPGDLDAFRAEVAKLDGQLGGIVIAPPKA
jgi:murein DD-endopeptidase MepM/ murein hydrolase activator NlpD